MDISSVITALIALVAGWLLGSLVTRAPANRAREEKQKIEEELRGERERAAVLQAENRRIPTLENEKHSLTDTVRILEADRARFAEKADRVPILERTLEGVQKQIQDLYAENAQLREAREADIRLIDELKDVRKNFENTFDSISKQALKENRENFVRESMEPLKSKLLEFEQKVDAAYKLEAAERNSLRGEIKNLVELNQQISKEASNLALALKGEKQGNWGELILEKV